MGFQFKSLPLGERELIEIASLLFVKMSQDGTLDDITISEHPSLFPTWTEKWTGQAGTIVMDKGGLYRSLHDVTNVGQNTKPSSTPSMWARVADPTQEFPEWVQPLGSQDAYQMGDKSSHNGKNWESTENNNVWEPGVFGWKEVVS